MVVDAVGVVLLAGAGAGLGRRLVARPLRAAVVDLEVVEVPKGDAGDVRVLRATRQHVSAPVSVGQWDRKERQRARSTRKGSVHMEDCRSALPHRERDLDVGHDQLGLVLERPLGVGLVGRPLEDAAACVVQGTTKPGTFREATGLVRMSQV